MSSSDTLAIYGKYYENLERVQVDHAWEKGESDVMVDNEGQGLPGTIKGKPAFEDGVLESLGLPSFKKWRREGGTMIAQSKNWTAIIPGGFRGADTPNKMNPISFDIGGYSALMGLVHVIVIPDQRITNCVTITEDELPLIQEGIQLLDTAFNLLVNGGPDEIGSVRWQLSQSGNVTMKDGTEKSMSVTGNDFIDECKGNWRRLVGDTQSCLDEMKMEVTCHGDSMSSIRKLHLHGFSSDYKTIAWSKMEEKSQSENLLPKNTPIEEVMDMATSGKVKTMKEEATNAFLSKWFPIPQPVSITSPLIQRQMTNACDGLQRQSSTSK
jgi:hypothetical protein